jgi:hypothetical protein
MGVLHEICGGPDIADDSSATIFLAGILARIDGPVLWCLHCLFPGSVRAYSNDRNSGCPWAERTAVYANRRPKTDGP